MLEKFFQSRVQRSYPQYLPCSAPHGHCILLCFVCNLFCFISQKPTSSGAYHMGFPLDGVENVISNFRSCMVMPIVEHAVQIWSNNLRDICEYSLFCFFSSFAKPLLSIGRRLCKQLIGHPIFSRIYSFCYMLFYPFSVYFYVKTETREAHIDDNENGSSKEKPTKIGFGCPLSMHKHMSCLHSTIIICSGALFTLFINVQPSGKLR